MMHTYQASVRAGIVRARRDQSREILDFLNCILGHQKLKQRLQIHPAMRGLAQGAVVEIEAVNVNVVD
jgi:hypothetical protein